MVKTDTQMLCLVLEATNENLGQIHKDLYSIECALRDICNKIGK